jgi:hypothetical protein
VAQQAELEAAVIREIRAIVWIVAVLSTTVCAAQASKESDAAKEPDAAKGRQEKRMDLMRQRVDALSAVGAKEEKLQFSEKPLLRYNDTIRGIADATVWGLGRTGRPRAVLVVEVYWGRQYMQYELTAVAEPPRLVRAASFEWTPPAAPFTWLKLPDEPPPNATESFRRRQIKQAAQKFSASEKWRGKTYQLRMMPQPILQYDDKEKGVIEGAVFVWAHGTNVEILMFLEGRQGEDGANHWVAGFSPLSGADLDVDYNGQDFWNSPQGVTASQNHFYFSRKDPLTDADREAFAPQ